MPTHVRLLLALAAEDAGETVDPHLTHVYDVYDKSGGHKGRPATPPQGA